MRAVQNQPALTNSFTEQIIYPILEQGGAELQQSDHDGIHRSIHNLENAYFRNKFEPELGELAGNMGVGVISDTDAQPIVLFSHLGRFALVMVGKIINIDELVKEVFSQNIHLSETNSGGPSPTEIVGTLISLCGSFEEGISYAQSRIKGIMFNAAAH